MVGPMTGLGGANRGATLGSEAAPAQRAVHLAQTLGRQDRVPPKEQRCRCGVIGASEQRRDLVGGGCRPAVWGEELRRFGLGSEPGEPRAKRDGDSQQHEKRGNGLGRDQTAEYVKQSCHLTDIPPFFSFIKIPKIAIASQSPATGLSGSFNC